jgi:NADPH:quinone reductase-like Zn-dependent oxidoreductase
VKELIMMSEDMMQAVRFHDYGGPDVLVVESVKRPQPQADQVLIRVLATGVNPADWKFRAGFFKEFMSLPLPWTPGLEGVGIVEVLGADVTAFRQGQAVYGVLTGGYAEYAVAPANDLQPKPAHLTFEQAASVAHGALTAWQAVIEEAKVQAGQRVLVHGAAGGVGLYAVQFAKWKGAQVIGTASSKNVEFVRSLGADRAIDYTAEQFETAVQDIDVVVDTVGGDIPERSLKILRKGGVLVSVAAHLTPEIGEAQGIRTASAGRATSDKLAQITKLLESKKITPVVGPIFPLAEARQAQELSQTGHGRGRIILLTA